MRSLAGFGFAAFISMAAAGERPPTYNVEATCRAAPTLGVGNGNTDQNCIRDETQARTQLGRLWSSFEPGRREMCAQEASNGGSPSYVDLLTCLQM